MFVIVTYDISSKRNGKVMKICRKYLFHKQKSVFEGMITQAKLNKLKSEIRSAIETDTDQVCIYKIESLKFTSKEELGKCQIADNIL